MPLVCVNVAVVLGVVPVRYKARAVSGKLRKYMYISLHSITQQRALELARQNDPPQATRS